MTYAQLLGALIGFANTAADYADALTPDMHLLVRDILTTEPEDEAMCRALYDRTIAAKHILSPGCATCTHPCGRTSDFDMNLLNLETPYAKEAKHRLLMQLRVLASFPETEETIQLLYAGLRGISEYRSDENLSSFIKRFQ